MLKLVQDETPGNEWAIYSAKIPSVTQTTEMISVNMRKNINVSIEMMMSSLSEIIYDYVSEIDLSHLLLFL